MDKAIRLSLEMGSSDSKMEVEEEFKENIIFNENNPLTPSDKIRNIALVKAISNIIWQSKGTSENIKIALSSTEEAIQFSNIKDTAPLKIVISSTMEQTRNIIAENLDTFQSNQGVIFLLLSVIFTRGIDKIRDGMDDKDASLTAEFGMCTQELMNLLLVGYAARYIFL